MAAVTPGTSSSEEESDYNDLLLRLHMLIYKCGHTALVNYIDQTLSAQSTTLSTCLANEKTTVKLLKGRRIITQEQYDLLYPSSGTVSTSDLNIPLIFCLMRNLKCFKLNEKFNWNILPGESDTSIEADICRLQSFRNAIVAKSSIKQDEFIHMWEQIEMALLRINKVYPIADFEQTINDIRYVPLHKKRKQTVTEKLQTAESKDEMVEQYQAPDTTSKIKDKVLRLKDSQEDAILDEIDLNNLLRNEGRTSREVFKECQKICQAIKDESEHIVHVEAAYRFLDDKHVIFLVFAAKNIQIDVIWETEIRIINNYSDESSVMLHCKENSPLTEKESQKIGEIIDRHSKKLMSDHKFLSAISASSVSSRYFGPMRLKHLIEKRPCIVLNVLVKGIIPLNEEYFPSELDGIPVDVIEGEVRLCVNKAADEYQENTTMGCKITSSTCPGKSGTLGGFIEHPEYGLCGITCAHVVASDDDKLKLKEMSTITVEEKFDGMMYQPDVRVPGNKLGKLVQVTYREGGNGKPGVDLALFRIETRAPKQGQFSDGTLPSFNEGLVWGKTGIPDCLAEVRKFGYVTLNTSGVMQFDNCVIREVPFHSTMTIEDGTTFTTTLYKQYHIKSCDVNIPFCKQGDSGALVFMEDNTGDETTLRCIGMLVAVMPGNSGCVTPINAIFDELKVKQFKPFTTHSTTHGLLFEQISGMLKTQFDGVNKRLGKLEQRMSRIEANTTKNMINKINKKRRRPTNATPTRPSNKNQRQGAQADPKHKKDRATTR